MKLYKRVQEMGKLHRGQRMSFNFTSSWLLKGILFHFFFNSISSTILIVVARIVKFLVNYLTDL